MKPTRQSILVIDSSETVRSVIKWALSQTYNITECLEPSDVGDQISKYSAILVDSDHSTQLAERLLQTEHAPPVIVMLSENQCASVLQTPLKIPVDFLLKPFDEFSLRQRLEKNKRKRIGKLLAFDTSATITAAQVGALFGLGFDVFITETDASFSTYLHEVAPDLILVDTSIPPLNRDRLIDQVVAYGRPWIALLDPNIPPEQIPAWVSAATDFVIKPFPFSELVFRAKHQLRHLINNPVTTNQSAHAKEHLPRRSDTDRDLLDQVYVTLHHEIKSPLTGILIGAQALEKQIAPEQRCVAHEIAKSAQRIKNSLDRLGSAESVSTTLYLNDIRMADFGSATVGAPSWKTP